MHRMSLGSHMGAMNPKTDERKDAQKTRLLYLFICDAEESSGMRRNEKQNAMQVVNVECSCSLGISVVVVNDWRGDST